MTQPAAVDNPPRPASIALVDIAYLFKKRWHTMGTNEGRNGAALATLRDLDWLRGGVEHLIVCRDAAPYKRKEVYEKYKANRPEIEPEEKAQRKFLFEEIQRLGYNVAWAQGYEADDVIATLAMRYALFCDDIRIVTVDKDAAQCITSHVKQYIPPVGDKDWEVRDIAAVQAKFGVPPHLMPLYQGLCGDKSDNIPGVRGVGEVNAAKLVNNHPSLNQLAEALATQTGMGRGTAISKAILANWEQLVLSVKLATLDTYVPLDHESLLVPRKPIEAPEKSERMTAEDSHQDGVTDAAFEEAMKHYQDKLPELRKLQERPEYRATTDAKDAELLEQESDRERQKNGEHDTVSNTPGDKAAEPARPTPKPSAIMTVAPTFTQHHKYGLSDQNLQPLDLVSARQVSVWLADSAVYPQFKTPESIFAIIARGKELGLGMTTALAGHHMVEGKPSASADLIRALAERDPTFEYLYPTVQTAERSVWIGKRRGYPTPVEFEYTIAEAEQAGLLRPTRFGKPSNWVVRPKDMLTKTAGSKLARILWPAATLGLYCPEEMGYTAEELEQAA